MALQAGDFVRIDYTGFDGDDVFDTTLEQVAEEHGLQSGGLTFEPIIVCVGQGQVLPGLDTALQGKPEKGSFRVTLAPEEGFGKKRADLLKLMPMKVFTKQQIKPVPGLDVDIDGMRGRIKSISGHRVIVDFNHPLSSKELRYDVMTHGKVTDVAEQVASVVGRMLRFTPDVKVDDVKAIITTPIKLPEEIQGQVSEQVTTLTAVETVEYVVNAPQ